LSPPQDDDLDVMFAHGRLPMQPFMTRSLPRDVDALAPDGSEIRLLVRTERGSMAHGTLPPGGVSLAVTHRTVEEMWFVTGGRAEIWRTQGDHEEVIEVTAGDALTIPFGTHFQFRTLGDAPFTFIMCTMPPWPGDDEAVPVVGRWEEGGGREERAVRG
jgi:mannose-6-phosphate isomerase-like protein (cupin superfamily)